MRLADKSDFAVGAEQLRRHRKAERDRLARTGLRRNDQVAVLRFGFENSGLNGGGRGIFTRDKGFAEKRGEVFKGGHAGRLAQFNALVACCVQAASVLTTAAIDNAP